MLQFYFPSRMPIHPAFRSHDHGDSLCCNLLLLACILNGQWQAEGKVKYRHLEATFALHRISPWYGIISQYVRSQGGSEKLKSVVVVVRLLPAPKICSAPFQKSILQKGCAWFRERGIENEVTLPSSINDSAPKRAKLNKLLLSCPVFGLKLLTVMAVYR